MPITQTSTIGYGTDRRRSAGWPRSDPSRQWPFVQPPCGTRARHEFDRGGSCLRAHDVADDDCSVAGVLDAVRGIDFVVDVVVRVHEDDVFLDAVGKGMGAAYARELATRGY